MDQTARPSSRSEVVPPVSRGRRSILFLRPPGAEEGGFEIPAGRTLTLGRDELNSIQIPHHSVEPFHAKLSLRIEQKAAPVAGAPPVVSTSLVVETVGGAVGVRGREAKGRFRVPDGVELQFGDVVLQVQREVESVAESSFRGLLLADFRRMIRSAPWFGISIAAHLLALLWLQKLVWREDQSKEETVLVSGRLEEQPALIDEPEVALDLKPEEETVQLEEPEVVLEEPSGDPEAAELEKIELPFQAIPMRMGTGSSGRPSRGLAGGDSLSLDRATAGGSGLVPFLKQVRGSGMDIVFLVDTTSSMRAFLDAAKATVDQTVTQLAALVPDLRIGVIAYRDHGQSEEYCTKVLKLSDDRYEIFNFIDELQAAGGGDIPEAVAEGLRVAADDLNWRGSAHRVVVLVGDAPPHEGTLSQLSKTVREFSSGGNSTVSTVFAGSYGSTMRADEVVDSFTRIAREGKGSFVSLEGDDVDRRLLLMTLGKRHEKDLDRLLGTLESGSREAMIRKKKAARDVDWLLDKLQRTPVHPDIVNALVEIADRNLLIRVQRVFEDERRPLAVRRAALFVLRRALGVALPLDPSRALSEQRRWVQRLDSLVQKF